MRGALIGSGGGDSTVRYVPPPPCLLACYVTIFLTFVYKGEV